MTTEKIAAIIQAIDTANGIVKSPQTYPIRTRSAAEMVVAGYLGELLALLPNRDRA